MKSFIVFDDTIVQTTIFLIKANNKKDALEKYSLKYLGVKKINNNRWLMKDYFKEKYSNYYTSLNELLKKEYFTLPNFRLEIKEVKINLDMDIQLLFSSKVKK